MDSIRPRQSKPASESRLRRIVIALDEATYIVLKMLMRAANAQNRDPVLNVKISWRLMSTCANLHQTGCRTCGAGRSASISSNTLAQKRASTRTERLNSQIDEGRRWWRKNYTHVGIFRSLLPLQSPTQTCFCEERQTKIRSPNDESRRSPLCETMHKRQSALIDCNFPLSDDSN